MSVRAAPLADQIKIDQLSSAHRRLVVRPPANLPIFLVPALLPSLSPPATGARTRTPYRDGEPR
jgi:hypothetical protein